MNIEIKENILIVGFKRKSDEVCIPTANKFLEAIEKHNIFKVVVDLSDFEFISSIEIANIFNLNKLLKEKGGEVVVSNINSNHIIKILEMTQFFRAVKHIKIIDEAIEYLKKSDCY